MTVVSSYLELHKRVPGRILLRMSGCHPDDEAVGSCKTETHLTLHFAMN